MTKGTLLFLHQFQSSILYVFSFADEIYGKRSKREVFGL